MWMIRSPGGQHAEELLQNGIIGLGWSDCADLVNAAKTPTDFYAAVKGGYPDYKDQQIINAGRQLYKFFREIQLGDTVVTYDSPQRTYHIGIVTGEVETDTSLPEFLIHFRKVDWQGHVDRDQLSLAARNSLGSSLTLFQPSEATIAELARFSEGTMPDPETIALSTETEDPFITAQDNSRELIKDKLMQLSWQDMQQLTAGILRAMNYKTKVSPPGADLGKDIIASPDGLGLEHPRIFVEVKHRKDPTGAPDIRTFIGGRNAQCDRCLYISTGGFTKDAKYEADRSTVPLTLINSDELVELLLEHYERADAEVRTLLPLRRTYWPR